MTKEELWKEAVTRVDAFIDNFSQDVRSTLYDRLSQEDVKDFLYGLYVDSAEPREKQIEHLSKEVDDLENMKATLESRIAELEAQIEKMKCCSMCKYYSMSFLPYWCTKNNTAPHCTSKCDKWEIKENE